MHNRAKETRKSRNFKSSALTQAIDGKSNSRLRSLSDVFPSSNDKLNRDDFSLSFNTRK